ncbi:MAG: multifunctional CCA addition/repair protein [Aeromonadales bacterium]|nr:multifunctional CCA addition/repair protein [Aeromonadales bacterium]
MQVYLVGGALRDKLLGIDNSDRDYVVVGSSVDEMKALGYSQVGKDFPVFLHPKTHEEYALARTERKNGQGYLGFNCDFNPNITLEEDLKRRDLTINAMAMDEKGNISDPFHGQDDLKNKVLRHVSEAFVEDPLRVLRVARFYAKLFSLGFSIAPETMSLMREIAHSGELKTLTPERVFLELEKALKTDNPERFILALREADALSEVLPEINKLFGVPGPIKWHPEIDSGIHTCMTLNIISKETCDPVTRFAMLCHDLGKGETPTILWPHHRIHNELGLKPLRCLCQRLKVPADYEQFAHLVVLYHSEMHHLYRKGALGIVNLFDKLDAWRKPERVKPFALCCKCDFLGRLGFENRPFLRSEYFLACFAICQTVKAKEFVEQGFTGADIKAQMSKKRVELVDEYLKTVPLDELNDSSNEKPALLKAKDMTYVRKPQNNVPVTQGFFKVKFAQQYEFEPNGFEE